MSRGYRGVVLGLTAHLTTGSKPRTSTIKGEELKSGGWRHLAGGGQCRLAIWGDGVRSSVGQYWGVQDYGGGWGARDEGEGGSGAGWESDIGVRSRPGAGLAVGLGALGWELDGGALTCRSLAMASLGMISLWCSRVTKQSAWN